MQTVDEQPETIHLYVVRETEPHPSFVPIILSVLALVILVVFCATTPYQQPVIRLSLRVPAVPLGVKTFTAQAVVVPTGIKTYAATTAHGVLTITNGSVIAQTLPAELTFVSSSGILVITDMAVLIPAGSVNGYGSATVPAHLATPGTNLPAHAVNQVLGAYVYVRNLQPFTGGRPAYSIKVVTTQDRQRAIEKSRNVLATVSTGLHYLCAENQLYDVVKMVLTWRCQFLTYHLPSYMHVTGTQIRGKNLIVAVWYVVRPGRIWVK